MDFKVGDVIRITHNNSINSHRKIGEIGIVCGDAHSNQPEIKFSIDGKDETFFIKKQHMVIIESIDRPIPPTTIQNILDQNSSFTSAVPTYREQAMRTASGLQINKEQLLLGALGLCGEAGETAEVVKKHLFHKIELDKAKLIKELGDVRWYMELLMVAIGTNMNEVEKTNIEKLNARYPNGFTTQASVERKDEK